MTFSAGYITKYWRPGSGDWDWREEARQLRTGSTEVFDQITSDISCRGVLTPVLLGDDGRVWDGHHRLVAAMYLDPSLRIPVEFGHTSTDWISTASNPDQESQR
jgi:hypothetical protein